MFPNIPNNWGGSGVYKPPKLGGWGSEQSNLRALVRVLVPPKLGGWGSEQSHFMCNTDNILSFSVLYITLFSLLSHGENNGVYGIQPQYVPLFRPPTP